VSLIGSDRSRAIVGLGASGLSVAQFLADQKIEFYVVDSRLNPPGLEKIKGICPEDRIFLGDLDVLADLPVTELYVSPGMSLATPVLQSLAEKGVAMRGDIDLFCDYVNAPIIAITGSNAKSTVTTLVGGLLTALERDAKVGGNLGLPALALIAEAVDYYVLELSSFQLETTHSLSADVACILNVSEDHMDRYDSLYTYQRVKQKVYRGCKSAVCNKQDILTAPLLPDGTPNHVFTTGTPDLNEFGLIADDDGFWLCHGVKRLYHSSQIALKGKHNFANILASLAIIHLLGEEIKDSRIADYLFDFKGLQHRCEFVTEVDGVIYINDSKGTNVGATIAAIEGFGSKNKNIHLILGGQGKDADFSPLTKHIKSFVKQVYLFGQDAQNMTVFIPENTNHQLYPDLENILSDVHVQAKKGDIVLFSPACASFDMYANFNARGDHFTALVNAICK